jgi:predicted Zn-ribbon and HTH transcriptional regulator
MKKKPLKPFVPVERRETIRQKIMSLLESRKRPGLSARDISVEAGISEKEAYEHLEHIRRTMNKSSYTFIVTPAVCKKCGFVFRKREKLNKPGRCPVCRDESIREPLFSIENK